MTRRWSAAALVVLLAALALLAAGCGGGGSSEAEGDTTAVESTVDEGESGDEGDASSLASEDCLELAGIGAKFAQAASATGGAGDPEGAADVFQQLVDKAPDEIKDDLAVLAGAVSEITEALKGVDLTDAASADPATLQKLQELGEKFSDPKYQEASKNVETWAEENCSSE